MYVGFVNACCKSPGLSNSDRWRGAVPEKRGGGGGGGEEEEEDEKLEAGEHWHKPPTVLSSIS